MKYFSGDGNSAQECIHPSSLSPSLAVSLSACVLVSDITVTGCEVRKQVPPSPSHWCRLSQGMSLNCLNSSCIGETSQRNK